MALIVWKLSLSQVGVLLAWKVKHVVALKNTKIREARDTRCVRLWLLECWEIQVHPWFDGRTLSMKELFYNSDITLSNFCFCKLIASLHTCISMDSLHHQRACIRLWSADYVSKFLDWNYVPLRAVMWKGIAWLYRKHHIPYSTALPSSRT